MKYRYLLIDNDNTLMDFHAAEQAALRETLTEAGIEPTDAVCARYSACLLYTSPSPRDVEESRMPSSA